MEIDGMKLMVIMQQTVLCLLSIHYDFYRTIQVPTEHWVVISVN